MSARRNDRSFLDELFAMCLDAPTWFGPVFALVVFAVMYWVFPWWLVPRKSDDIMQRTVSQVVGGAVPRIAPFAAGLVIFVWLVAEGKKFVRRRERAQWDAAHARQELTTQPSKQAPSPPNAPNCPECDSPMKLRTARQGKNPGAQFWGCSRFPNCRGTREFIVHARE